MEIITVTEEISAPFVTMVPDFVMEGNVWVIGCVDGEEIISVAVVGVDEPNLELRWLYTDEPQRNRGGARMILEHLKNICDKHNFSVSFYFDDNSEYRPIMFRLCEPLMFDFDGLKISEYIVYRSQIKSLEFYSKYKAKPLSGFKGLADVNPKKLEKLVEAGEIDRFDLARANTNFSFVLEEDNEIVAVILLEDDDMRPDLYLSYFYVMKNKEAVGIQFLRNAIEIVFSENSMISVITFQTVSEAMDKLVKKIIGEEPDAIRYVHRAEYDMSGE